MSFKFKKRKESSNFRYWSDSELEFIVSNYATMTAEEIAIHLKRSKHSVCYQVKKLCLSKRRCLSSSDIQFIKCNLGKLSCQKIACHLGFSFSIIYRFCKLNKLCFRVCGESHGNTIHSDEDVLLIRALRDEGLSLSDIYSKFDIPMSTIQYYLYGKQRGISSDYYLYVD